MIFLHPCLTHHIRKHQCPGDIVVIVFPRLCHGLTRQPLSPRNEYSSRSSPPQKSYLKYPGREYLPCKTLTSFPVIAFTRSSDFSDELLKLSSTTTSYPAFCSSTHVWLPIYPAPPVTKIAITLPPFLSALYTPLFSGVIISCANPGTPISIRPLVNHARVDSLTLIISYRPLYVYKKKVRIICKNVASFQKSCL